MTYRLRLKDDEFDLIQQYRDRHRALAEECDTKGVPIENVKHYWTKSKHFSLNVVNDVNQKSYEDIRDELISQMGKYSPKYPKVKYEAFDDSHLLVVDPADVHIGKLASSFEVGEDYNSQIAVKRVLDGVHGILNKSKGFDVDEIMFVIGNDILHIDTPKRMTTSGTPQDTDGMWYTNFLLAKQLYVDCIELLMQVAPVHVVFNPSNHDYTNGFFLADAISAWFRNAEDVTFDVSISHRKYYQYHNNLIGTTHGDGAKENDLPLLMANEASKGWSETKHKYIYIHHKHHKWSKDIMNVTLEGMRSPSEADSWHHRNGYQHSPRSIEGFIHHKIHGQVARITHTF